MGSTALPGLLRSPHPGVRGIATLYPYADLRELRDWQAPGRTSENAERYSMVTSFADGVATPPLLVIRAGADAPLIVKGIDALIAEGLRRNAPIEVMNVPNAETGFDRTDGTVTNLLVDFLQRRVRDI